jgi:hypothetical protein
MLVPRGGCRPLQPTRSTPSWHRRQAVAPQGFGLLPVRSPLLRESSLFLGVLRCFSSPGRAPGGLPHSDIPGSQAASASPGHFAAWPRPSSAANAKASTMRPSCGYPAPPPIRDRSCPRPQTGTRQRDGPAWSHVRPAAPFARRLVGLRCVCVVRVSLCMYCAVRAGTQTRAPASHRSRCDVRLGSRQTPQGLASSRGRRTRRVPRGALSRCTTRKSFRPAGRQTHRSRGRQTSSEVMS